jgi:hypothetical protein
LVDPNFVALRTHDISRTYPNLPTVTCGKRLDSASAHDAPTVQETVVPPRLLAKVFLLDAHVVCGQQLSRKVTHAIDRLFAASAFHFDHG